MKKVENLFKKIENEYGYLYTSRIGEIEYQGIDAEELDVLITVKIV